MADKLYVIAPISNPSGYKVRYKLYQEFKKYMSQFKDVVLLTVELALKDQPFAVTSYYDQWNIQLRGYQEYWHKEMLINIGLKYLPPDAKYVAWIDADVIFANPNWVQDTIDALKKHKVVQMFSEYVNLGPQNQIVGEKATSFIYSWMQEKDTTFDPNYGSAKKGVTGLAWAARREVLDNLGGLLDWMIVGSSDWYMAYSLIGCSHLTNNQLKPLKTFQEKCDEFVGLDVGYVDGCALHYWHGPKSKRGYGTRWRILIENNYDPELDLVRNEQGLYIVNPEKPKLLEDLKEYFNSRDEDSVNLR